ncbi:MAG: hypothetical protein EP298_05595 [Gammaproteobacteria bacterium]|nr:MAG: hypothetical protein EP298_05595 [Gammaproteobacteria bacterium]UTW42748.1 hypothetical protein KFE69_00960 [bacterium SCSIO 12844]
MKKGIYMDDKNKALDMKVLKKFELIVCQTQKSDYVLIDFYIPENLVYFKGHFDSCPILPGVAQLDLAIHYACEYFGLQRADISAVDAMKFMKVIKPKTHITLELMIKNEMLIFKYLKDNVAYSSGKIRLQRDL